ncbi:MAG: hypothetical protein B7X02_00280 [Rhodospirillales bacterium 12-54-5]|nr:MAG: hypothetical protein B7X02_00280 [Rhodospirillales bacterium 12-54-5]
MGTVASRGGPYSVDCLIQERWCAIQYEDAHRNYSAVSVQQILNAVQQVWIEQGYTTQSAVLGEEKGIELIPDTTFNYGPASRQGECAAVEASVTIHRRDDKAETAQPLTVGISFREPYCPYAKQRQSLTPANYENFFRRLSSKLGQSGTQAVIDPDYAAAREAAFKNQHAP